MIKVLNIPMYDGGLDSVVKEVLDTCLNERDRTINKCISATGAHGLVHSRTDKHFAEVLSSFYCNLPDGVPAVWAGRAKGAKTMERCYGPSFFEAIMRRSARLPINHFFCGGKQGVAEALREACETRFANSNCVGVYSPPFREMAEDEMRALGESITASRAQIVWIGLSTPKQELFAHRIRKYLRTQFIITVGAAFDFHTGRLKQAPRFIQTHGLEWSYRLYMEPRRLYRRYLKVVPLFLFYSILDLLKHFYSKSKGELDAG